MTDKDGPGQAAKKTAETRTAAVAAENAEQRPADAASAPAVPGLDSAGAALRIGTDQTPEREDGGPARVVGRDAVQDPFPDYDSQTTDELASLAKSRNVEINRDVEKAELIKELRADDSNASKAVQSKVTGAEHPYASYDVMPLEKLRDLAAGRDVKLPEAFVRAHLLTELRAADTSGGVSVAFDRAPLNPS